MPADDCTVISPDRVQTYVGGPRCDVFYISVHYTRDTHAVGLPERPNGTEYRGLGHQGLCFNVSALLSLQPQLLEHQIRI